MCFTVQYIEVCELLPVQAFGCPVPAMEKRLVGRVLFPVLVAIVRCFVNCCCALYWTVKCNHSLLLYIVQWFLFAVVSVSQLPTTAAQGGQVSATQEEMRCTSVSNTVARFIACDQNWPISGYASHDLELWHTDLMFHAYQVPSGIYIWEKQRLALLGCRKLSSKF